jgi:hypothetical protein
VPKLAKATEGEGDKGQLAWKESGTSKGVGKGKGEAGEMLKQAAEGGRRLLGRPMVEVTQAWLRPSDRDWC